MEKIVFLVIFEQKKRMWFLWFFWTEIWLFFEKNLTFWGHKSAFFWTKNWLFLDKKSAFFWTKNWLFLDINLPFSGQRTDLFWTKVWLFLGKNLAFGNLEKQKIGKSELLVMQKTRKSDLQNSEKVWIFGSWKMWNFRGKGLKM